VDTENNKILTCQDFTVTNQKFDLVYNNELDMLETFPQPKVEDLALYYESSTYISHTDAKESLTDKLYQAVKKFTLNKKLKLINSFETEQKNLLDIGCGTGDFLLNCKNNGWNVVGVEPNINARYLAETKISENNTSRIYSELDFINSEKFDVITLWHVLEHIPNLNEYISKLKLLLKPNGVLVVAVPNYKCYDAKYYKEYWAAYDVPRHLWHFSKKSMHLLFSKEKMVVAKIYPMIFDSFYVSLLSEKNKRGTTNLIVAFCIGLVSNLKAFATKEYSSLIYVIKNG
tara:strand:+ start:51097 stop:51957 length:861 start_codon:yes stop_codon:yes gene_type:complete